MTAISIFFKKRLAIKIFDNMLPARKAIPEIIEHLPVTVGAKCISFSIRKGLDILYTINTP